MEINGRALQEEVLEDVKIDLEKLKEKGVTPCIAIVTLGPEETWQSYVGQKIKLADRLGIDKKLISLRPNTTEEVIALLKTLDRDPSIHGLIVQRPFPTYIDTERIIQSISKNKDIDGFREDSLFEVPVWLAVKYLISHMANLTNSPNLMNWLSYQSILVIGKGETAGLPTIRGIEKLGLKPSIIDSKTEHPDKLIENADIVISATGKSDVIPTAKLKDGVKLIGIGLHRKNDRLVGDYDENEAKKKASHYTPTPGGVGPLNLAFLFKNLVKAASLRLDNSAGNK